ncbi:MAG: class II aldolase/adducin family protein, partial [Desulfurococcaceae archaeon]
MYTELKEKIVEALKYIESKGWNQGRSGNMSILIRERGHVLVTPSGALKAKLQPKDLLVVDLSGNVVEGTSKPTIELPFHLAIYRKFNNINEIVHA